MEDQRLSGADAAGLSTEALSPARPGRKHLLSNQTQALRPRTGTISVHSTLTGSAARSDLQPLPPLAALHSKDVNRASSSSARIHRLKRAELELCAPITASRRTARPRRRRGPSRRVPLPRG